MVLVNQQCKWWCQKCLIMVARLHIDFQPVVELDLKDNRQLHFLPFERTGPNSRQRNMTRRLEEASNNNVSGRSGGKC